MSTSLRGAWPQVVGHAWADPEFRRRLLENPGEVLTELGVEVSAGHQVVVLEDTPGTTHLVLPQPPANLNDVAGPVSVASRDKQDIACCEGPGEPPACCEAGEPPACCESGERPACCETGEPPACCEAGEPPACCEAGEPPACCETGERPACCEAGERPACCQDVERSD